MKFHISFLSRYSRRKQRSHSSTRDFGFRILAAIFLNDDKLRRQPHELDPFQSAVMEPTEFFRVHRILK
ncbi:MAG: hypothetical protein EZS28_004597 [Streblomastix strix]|uniref:Uncharacterized protein n=1 Tax=Streblomastix strix TaxID=222440 RepID=A0A5J4WZC1_9EUKA|nr:MAG: hypothetical protein EZS28_004597 [Streblomastix strix]